MATKFITVSIEIMHDKELNQSQKFILAEIEQLSQLDKGCFASNQHFSELIGITKENVSRNINDLHKRGYIDVEIVNGSRNHTRIIRVTKIVRPPYQNSKTPLLKQQETKENKTINKTINKTYSDSFEKLWKWYKENTTSFEGTKSKAYPKFNKAIKRYGKDIVKKALYTYVTNCKNSNTFTKHLSTILNEDLEEYANMEIVKKEENKNNQYKSKQQINKENIEKFARMYGDLPSENETIENVEIING